MAPSRSGLSGRRAAIVEDHLLQRRRTEHLLRSRGMHIAFSGESMDDFLSWRRARPSRPQPDLLILDLFVDRGPRVSPEDVGEVVDSGVAVLVLSAMTLPKHVREVLRAGVQGVVGKRDPEADIVRAAEAVLKGDTWTSPEAAAVIAGDEQRPQLSIQEERALMLYVSGLTLTEVAEAMNVMPDTAKQYLKRVRAKYAAVQRDARTKVDLARAAWLDGYVDPSTTNDGSPSRLR